MALLVFSRHVRSLSLSLSFFLSLSLVAVDTFFRMDTDLGCRFTHSFFGAKSRLLLLLLLLLGGFELGKKKVVIISIHPSCHLFRRMSFVLCCQVHAGGRMDGRVERDLDHPDHPLWTSDDEESFNEDSDTGYTRRM